MSLINKMLQDLDKRGAAPNHLGMTGRDVHVVPDEPAQKPAQRIGLLFFAATAVFAGAWFGWAQLQGQPSKGSLAQSASTPVTTPKPAESPAPPPASPTIAAVPAVASASSAPATVAVDTAPPKPMSPPAQTAVKPVPTTVAQAPGAAVSARVEQPSKPVLPSGSTVVASDTKVAESAPAKAAAAPGVAEKSQADGKTRPEKAGATATVKEPSMHLASLKPTAGSKDSDALKQPPKAAPIQAGDAKPVPVAKVDAKPADKEPLQVKPEPVKEPSIDRRVKPAEQPDPVEAEFRKAVTLMNQGRVNQAIDVYGNVLRVKPSHSSARQAVVALLVESKRLNEAQRLLQEGLAIAPAETGWAMLLARIQLESGDAGGAIETLNAYAGHARNRADYHAFLARLLQMQSRNKEAVEHYEIAVRQSPGAGPWLTGLAISLEADNRAAEAKEVYQRALATRTLDNELQSYVERKLQQLQ